METTNLKPTEDVGGGVVPTKRKRVPLNDISNQGTSKSTKTRKIQSGMKTRAQVKTDTTAKPRVAKRAKIVTKAIDNSSPQKETISAQERIAQWKTKLQEDNLDVDYKNLLKYPDYISDMKDYWHSHEKKYMPVSSFIGCSNPIQIEITPHMRAILVDWLVEVAEEYKLNSETLYICVNLVDRFLMKRRIPRSKLQLLGCACMLLASKYEEVYGPGVDEFVYISDNTYVRGDIMEMENDVVEELEFRVSATTPCKFLERFLDMFAVENKERYLARYLLELALLEIEMFPFTPCQQAAGSIYLARLMLNRADPWPSVLEVASCLSKKDLRLCVKYFHSFHAKASKNKLQAVQSKYQLEDNLKVAEIPKLVKLPLN